MVDYLFKKIALEKGDLYFVIKRDFFSIKDTIYSFKINPIGLFVKENDEYIFLPFENENCDVKSLIDAFVCELDV